MKLHPLSWQAVHRLAVLLFLVLCAVQAAAQPVAFADGAATVTPPSGYTYSLEDKGETVVLRPPQAGLFEMRFTFNAVPERKDRPQLAREFVVDVAKKKGKQPTRFRNGSIGFIERAPQTSNRQEEFRNLHGLLTLGKGYVTLTLTVPEKNVQLAAVHEFVNQGMLGIIESLKATGRKP
jgi:hypothetical protein